MRISFVLPFIALATLSMPVMAQDIFQPFVDMMEQLSPEAKPPAKPLVKPQAPVPQTRPVEAAPADIVKPEPVEPEAVEPEAVEPEPVEPEAVEPPEPVTDLPRPRPEAPVAVPEPAPSEPETPAVEPPQDEEAVAPEPPKEEAVVAPEPPRVFQTACPAVLMGQVEAEALPPISEGQCRAQSPLSITGVMANGRIIPFSGPATLDCGMATALPQWVGDVDSYLRATANTAIESVVVGTSHMCRNVNNAVRGSLSFHAFADALDVVGFKLEDGRTVTVEEAWTGSKQQGSAIVRFAHSAACGRFTTVLGPEADAAHHDHLHLDLGCHGKTCTARLCE